MIYIKNHLKWKFNKIKYTIQHRRCIIKLEKEILGKNSLKILLHDLDKIPLIIIFGKKASKIHRRYSRHHDNNRKKKKGDYIEMILDWESARFTKPDKPLTARETLYKFYPNLRDKLEPILNELQL